jgi:hypothetical protein
MQHCPFYFIFAWSILCFHCCFGTPEMRWLKNFDFNYIFKKWWQSENVIIHKLIFLWENFKLGIWLKLSSDCLPSTRPYVQTSVPIKKKKENWHYFICFSLMHMEMLGLYFFYCSFLLTKHILIKIGCRFKFAQVKLGNNQSHDIPSKILWDPTWLN